MKSKYPKKKIIEIVSLVVYAVCLLFCHIFLPESFPGILILSIIIIFYFVAKMPNSSESDAAKGKNKTRYEESKKTPKQSQPFTIDEMIEYDEIIDYDEMDDL